MVRIADTARGCLDQLEAQGFDLISYLQSFCEVHPRTAQGWVKKSLPKGELLMRLYASLELLGCEVKELEDMMPVVRLLNLLVGYQVVSLSALGAALGYSSEQHTRVVLRGESKMQAATCDRAERLIQQERDSLNQTKRELLASALDGTSAEVADTLFRLAEHEAEALEAKTDLAKPLAALLMAALPLAKELESNLVPEEERERLRKLVGNENFFELTNLLHRLSGKRAREVYRNGGE